MSESRPTTGIFKETVMSEFKRIKELGLTVHRELYGNDREYIYVRDLERLLEKAVKVYAYMGPARPGGMWINEGQQDADSTHTATLLNVQPIVRESEEVATLRECLEFVSEQITNQSSSQTDMQRLFRRLCKLMEQK